MPDSHSKKQGNLLIVLHAHLPYVRHPDHDRFLEEDWLFEAITETYLPLIDMMRRLTEEGVDFRLTFTVTPPLASMLVDEVLQNRYVTHIDRLIQLSQLEIERTKGDPQFHGLAWMYHHWFRRARQLFVDYYQCNLLTAFKQFQELGKIDILTCGSTHGYFPNMEENRRSVRSQIKIACDRHEELFGRRPLGIWLPECGYWPGDDQVLKENGILYFFSDAHAILHGSPRPKYGVFAPIACPSGIFAFGRDLESSKQVWSAKEGYPGDAIYREFYRDIGYDLDYNYVRPFLHGDGNRTNLGIKYYRITDGANHKEPYQPEWAREKAAEHAGNFMFNRERQVEYLESLLKKSPLIVSLYDAELFGHWWYEGPQFIEFLIRKIHFDSKILKLTTAPEYLKENSKFQVLTPSFSSWGYKGYSEFWLEGSNDWIYPHLHEASRRMHELALEHGHRDANRLVDRALKQAARELLLAESSDWAFIMKTGTNVSYAHQRIRTHLSNFLKLYDELKRHQIDENTLAQLEKKDNIFPNVDWRVYA